MDLNEAIKQARLILGQEAISPTLNYVYVSDEWPRELQYEMTMRQQSYSARSVGHVALSRMRARDGREVFDNPKLWKFESKNFEMLMGLYGQLSEFDRGKFIGGLLNTYSGAYFPVVDGAKAHWPSWNGYLSPLPLLGEFAVRNSQAQMLFTILSRQELPSESHVLLVMQLREMLSLNFNLFTKSDLDTMPDALKGFREMANRQTWAVKRERGGTRQVQNPHFRKGYSSQAHALVKHIDGFLVQCTRAQYFHLQDDLSLTTNMEIEQDRFKVENYLVKLGFSSVLKQSLDEAEKNFVPSSNLFELKDCLSHLRTFYEHMHREAAAQIAETVAKQATTDFNTSVQLLESQKYMTEQQGKFARGLMTLLSDEGAHALMTARVFARLLRNMVIEYGVMFLTIMDNKGVQLKVNATHQTAAKRS